MTEILKRHRWRRDSAQDDGFTIVELLVAFVIASLVLTLIPGALRLNDRVWDAQKTTETTSAHATLDRYLDSRLSAAREIFERTDNGDVRLLFEGGADHVQFTAPARSGPNGRGLYQFELRLKSSSENNSKVLAISQHAFAVVLKDKLATQVAERVVPGSIKNLRFRYYGMIEPDQTYGWSSDWKNRDHLPQLVEILIEARGNGAISRKRTVRLRMASNNHRPTPDTKSLLTR